MSLIPWRPFREIEKWFEEGWPEILEWPERFLLPELRAPRMDIYEEKGKVVAEVELPGVDPKDIDIEVKDNLLKVEAKKEAKKEEKKKGYYRKEISTGYYKRVVSLPAKVKGEKAEATYENGLLKIVIPKIEKKGEKKGIKIKVKKG